MKRALDVAVSAVLLAVLSPLLAVLAALVRFSSSGPALHRARRVGRGGAEFTMYKLRTMRRDAATTGPGITARGDARVTSLGRALRRTHLDELPQLWNVLRGDMSLVGPRPEDPRFVARYTPEQRAVLSVRPGITGPAQLAYRDEARLLPADATEDAYARDVLPAKLAIDLAYVRRPSLWRDLAVLARTIAGLVRR
ncbi:MAG TPA: sugar transferase [Candidatus Limnocylindria bacterium]|nr:sugar transferase [Candidatus Limnocylindria bacterium]